MTGPLLAVVIVAGVLACAVWERRRRRLPDLIVHITLDTSAVVEAIRRAGVSVDEFGETIKRVGRTWGMTTDEAFPGALAFGRSLHDAPVRFDRDEEDL